MEWFIGGSIENKLQATHAYCKSIEKLKTNGFKQLSKLALMLTMWGILCFVNRAIVIKNV